MILMNPVTHNVGDIAFIPGYGEMTITHRFEVRYTRWISQIWYIGERKNGESAMFGYYASID